MRREFGFKVTPKGVSGSLPLPTVVLIPYLLLALASLVPALAIPDAGAAGGYYFWSLMNGVIYLGVAVIVVVLHERENPRRAKTPRTFGLISPKAVSIGTTLTALLGAMALHGPQAINVVFPAASAAKVHGAAPVRRGPLELGVTTTALAENTVIPWTPRQLRQVVRFEHDAGAHVAIVMWYVDWAHHNLLLSQLKAVAAHGSIPEISWEPWDATLGSPQPSYSLAGIARGEHDDSVREIAATIRAFGRPVLLRFAQEMNGHWYPWSAPGGSGFPTPSDFVAAWRHLHDVFAEAGARNVRWVWSPVTGRVTRRLYPGDRYVDVVGVSGYNGGSLLRWGGGWRSFTTVFSPTLAELRRIAPGKPIQISEVASAETGGSKGAWITGMWRALEEMPFVTSLVWFNDVKQANWPIESSRAAASAFRAGARKLTR